MNVLLRLSLNYYLQHVKVNMIYLLGKTFEHSASLLGDTFFRIIARR